MSAWTAWGLTLIAVAVLWIVGGIARLVLDHFATEHEVRRIEEARRRAEAREAQSEAEWRAWYFALPEAEKLAGARMLLDAVRSETPLFDGLAAETFRAQLDEGRTP